MRREPRVTRARQLVEAADDLIVGLEEEGRRGREEPRRSPNRALWMWAWGQTYLTREIVRLQSDPQPFSAEPRPTWYPSPRDHHAERHRPSWWSRGLGYH